MYQPDVSSREVKSLKKVKLNERNKEKLLTLSKIFVYKMQVKLKSRENI